MVFTLRYLKWHPIRKWAKVNPGVCFVSGRRKKESKRRMRLQKYLEKPEKHIQYILRCVLYDGSVVFPSLSNH